MLLVTTSYLYGVKSRREVFRKISIRKIYGLSRPTKEGDFDFIVHLKDEYDFRFFSEERDKLFQHIKAVFFAKLNRNLPIYDVTDGLNKYVVTKDKSTKNNNKLPPESMRNHSEDIFEPWNPLANQTMRMNEYLSTPSNEEEEDLNQFTTVKPVYTRYGDSNVVLSDF